MAPMQAGCSPHRLLQEVFGGDDDLRGWRVLIVCTTLNRGTGRAAEPALRRLFITWPTPRALALADEMDVAETLRPCGLQRERARRARAISQAFVDRVVADPAEVPFVGPYALDAWSMFVRGVMPTTPPRDGHLALYWAWATGANIPPRLDRRDVALMTIASGPEAVWRLSPRPSDRTVIGAARRLRQLKRGDAADALLELFGLANRRRGVAAPRVGCARRYRGHPDGSGRVVARIPLHTLGCDEVVAEFRDSLPPGGAGGGLQSYDALRIADPAGATGLRQRTRVRRE